MDELTREQLARYRRLRAVQMDLHRTLMKELPKSAIEDCAEALGLYEKGTLVFGSESEMSVLMDYCIYDYRWDGQNVIERHLGQLPVEAGSDERVLLEAMVEARYSLLVVEEVIEGFGVQTRDLLNGEGVFVMDVAFSQTAPKDVILACRIISPGDGSFSMTTGAALAGDSAIMVGSMTEIARQFGRDIGDLDIAEMSPEKAADLSASIIRIFLEEGASSCVTRELGAGEKAAKPRPKVGRNDPCPCGSGKKYKKCCGKATAPVSLPDRRLMERDLRGIERLVESQGFESADEVDTYLDRIVAGGSIPEWVPETPVEQAQGLVYEALEASSGRERIRLALEAINIWQDCTDAYVLLAEEAAETPEQARDWYQRGVEAGERFLGPDVFVEDVGYFWGLIETRPYMRAREGLAACLFVLGEHEAAMEHYQDMLRLNPDDNQGVRYSLLRCLMGQGDVDAAEDLLQQYEDEASAFWLFAQALVAFIRQGDSPEARRRLDEAMEENPHVVPYLLGQRRMPRTLPDYIGFGDKDEAVACVAEFGDVWSNSPGALDWLKVAAQRRKKK